LYFGIIKQKAPSPTENRMTKTTFLLSLTAFLYLQILSCSYLDPIKAENEKTMKKYFADFLGKTDKVEIQYFALSDTVSQILKDPKQIDIFKELIIGKEEKHLSCDTTGRLLYFKGDTLLLKTYFSTPGTGSKLETGVVTYFFKPDIYKTTFTYRAGMSIDEYFYDLKTQHIISEKNK
jgi:hypothetical protein